MTASTTARLHPAAAAPALPGTWKLVAGRAITLQPTQNGLLRVAHGRLWATFDGPHAGPLNGLGDLIVEVGDSMRVAAGQRLVIEAWTGGNAAYFTWEPVLASARVRTLAFGDLLQPLAELRAAAALGAHAAARVLTILAKLARDAVWPRRTWPAGPSFNAQCKA